MIAQRVERQHVFERNLEYQQAIPGLLLFDQPGERGTKHQSSQRRLDLHLPDADDTENQVVRGITQGFEQRTRESLGITIPSKEGVRIEQRFHSPSQNSSGRGASKSSCIVMPP